jgi:uncharacterized protein
MDERLLLFLALLLAASLVGMLPPLVRRWSDRGLHNFVAASAGIFLGTVFLHLLPELAGGDSHGHGHVHAAVDSSAPWAAALVGFLGLFLIEKVWLREKPGADGHTLVWVSTYVGLSVHAFTAGLGLAALLEHPELSVAVVAVLWHKLTESFSLSSVMRLAGAPAKRHLAMLGFFACITPTGLLLGAQLAGLDATANAVLTGLAAGTFLYVAVCDLLPEVFHHTDRRMPRVIALVIGVIASGLAPQFESFEVLQASLMHFGDEALAMFLAMAPYLLLGFAVAGLVQVFLEPAGLQRWLKGEGPKPIATASILGAPLPLCSCSVIPVASGLRKAGAGKGPTSAFLIATPETGVDSVSVTYALFDPVMAVVRPVASVLSALVTGLAVGVFAKSGKDDEPNAGLDETVANPCCSKEREADAPAAPQAESGSPLRRAARFAFVDMVDDLAGALIVGILLSALIAAWVPADWFDSPLLAGSGAIFVMLLVGVPIYVCAAASTPIAATLLLKGLSPGAVLVFLLAGPATNLATLTVMGKSLGKRALAVHLGVLMLVTLVLGFATDALYGGFGFESFAKLGEGHEDHAGWLSIASAIVMGLLFAASFARRLKPRRDVASEPAPSHSH